MMTRNVLVLLACLQPAAAIFGFKTKSGWYNNHKKGDLKFIKGHHVKYIARHGIDEHEVGQIRKTKTFSNFKKRETFAVICFTIPEEEQNVEFRNIYQYEEKCHRIPGCECGTGPQPEPEPVHEPAQTQKKQNNPSKTTSVVETKRPTPATEAEASSEGADPVHESSEAVETAPEPKPKKIKAKSIKVEAKVKRKPRRSKASSDSDSKPAKRAKKPRKSKSLDDYDVDSDEHLQDSDSKPAKTEAKAPAKKTPEKSAESTKKTTEASAIPDKYKHMYADPEPEFKPTKARVSKHRVTKPKSVEPKYTEDFEPAKVSGVVDMLPMVGVGAIVLVLLLFLCCCCCRKKPEEEPLNTYGDTTGAQPSEPTPYQTWYGNGSTQQTTTGYTGYGTTKKKSGYGNTTPNYLQYGSANSLTMPTSKIDAFKSTLSHRGAKHGHTHHGHSLESKKAHERSTRRTYTPYGHK